MKRAGIVLCTLLATGCAVNDYDPPDYLSGQLVKSEPVNGKLYCYYKLVDLENNVVFSTVPAQADKPCTKKVKIDITNDKIIWLK